MANQPELSEREILERMRNRVNAAKIGSNDALPAPAVPLPRQFAFIADKGVPGYHLGRLRQNVEMVYQLQCAVGTVNPRPAGLLNQAIQSGKKLMSRVLSWYTRPLHQFQSAVARAFEEDLHALESLQNQLTTAATMNQQRLDSLQQGLDLILQDLRRVAETQHEHAATLYEQVDDLRKIRIEERLRSQELKLRRLESQGASTSQVAQQTDVPLQNLHVSELDFNYFLFQE